jgi:hypothetical protein
MKKLAATFGSTFSRGKKIGGALSCVVRPAEKLLRSTVAPMIRA